MQCPKCKLENPDTAARCDCGWDFATSTIQTSYLSYADTDRFGNYNLASLSDRFLGQLLDSLIVIVAFILAVIGSSFLSESFSVALFCIALLFAVLYILLADGLAGGQSYGKQVTKTAVIDANTGEPCTFGKSFVRNLLLSILGIIDWIFIFGSKRQRLGDMLANTIVIKLPRR
ncbi:MAG: RDD family protein [Acidobacteriota bacterium]